MPDPRMPVDDLRAFAFEIKALQRRLDTLEAPSGTQAYRSVSKLQALVEDIQAQLNDYIANGTYNKAQIDSKFSAMEALIDQKVAAYVASYMASNVQIGGALRVLGDTQLDGAVRAPGVRNTDLTSASGRVAVWQGGSGDPRLGHT